MGRYNHSLAKYVPVSRLVSSQHVLGEDDTYPSSQDFLLKWRPVFLDNVSTNISKSSSLSLLLTIVAYGPWEGYEYIYNAILKCWIVSVRTNNILGFAVSGIHFD